MYLPTKKETTRTKSSLKMYLTTTNSGVILNNCQGALNHYSK